MAEPYRYGDVFFTSIGRGAARSAEVLVPMVLDALAVESVIDIGAGRGVWLREVIACGRRDVVGIDGDYVPAESLVIAPENFLARDLARPFDLERRFDLAICLEVGEHLPHEASGVLVDNIARHSPAVLFSAAVPGQGGENHINEQPLDFWRQLFAERGYVAFDPFRPLLRGHADVEPWYRYNVLLYVQEASVTALSPDLMAARLAEGRRIPELSSPLFTARKAVLRRLPRRVVTLMARIKHRLRTLARTSP